MRRLGGAPLLAVCVLAAAWLAGSTALAVLGIGLAVAALGARLWSRVVAGTLRVERLATEGSPVEGEPLRVEVELRGRRWLATRVEWHDRVGALGEHCVPVGRGGRACLDLEDAPRGRYPLGPGRLLAWDPLGLTRVELVIDRPTAVTVRPRVPELETLFTDTGAWGEGGRRASLRRPSGLEPHGVREYVEGEPLRAVHWPTSARRGELMVRELEDAPRDSVAVVLDVAAEWVVGARGVSSLDDAVRATAGLVRAHALRSRRVLLAIGTPEPDVHRVRSLGGDWDGALEALGRVEPSRSTSLRELVAPRGALATTPDLVVVTGRPEAVADALVARAAVGRHSALVAVDSPTYAGRGPSASSPALLRLAGAGVALAVVRHGVPLPDALGALRARAVG
jgi:uncharacterized protein (DUF58 family)